MLRKAGEIFGLISSLWRSVKLAVKENEDAQTFVNQHKSFFCFIQKRLDKNSFFGLPLTLLTLAFIYVLFQLFGVVEAVLKSGLIVSVDLRIENLLAVFRSGNLTGFFLKVTILGKWQTVATAAASIVIILWIWNKKSCIIPFIVVLAGSSAFTALGKLVIHRPRPSVALYVEPTYSFPSGHASIAAALYGFLVYILFRNPGRMRFKIISLICGILAVLLIGLSRLYLGVHFLSDVLGGYLEGILWLIIGIGLSEYFLTKTDTGTAFASRKILKFSTAVIISLVILFYIGFSLNYKMPAVQASRKVDLIRVENLSAVFDENQYKYTETLLGTQQEPISFIIAAKNDAQFLELFRAAGWDLAESVSFRSLVKSAETALLKKPYPHGPITPDFWNTMVHDFGFEKPTGSNNIRTRHHARFWATDYIIDNGYRLYVGTASFDSGVKWGITHKIDPDIDTEREFLFKDLEQTGRIFNTSKEQFVMPKLGKNFTGDMFFTDGKLYSFFVKAIE